jgi:hypothetical protein
MLKSKAQDREGNPVFIFGLSDESIVRLKQGKPILIDIKELGSIGKVLIYSGATEIQAHSKYPYRAGISMLRAAQCCS